MPFKEAHADWGPALIVSRLAWSVGLGGWRCHLQLSSRDADTRFVSRGGRNMIRFAGSDTACYSSAGVKLSRFIRLQELARHVVHDRDIELVHHFQHFLRPEASSCGNDLLRRLTFPVLR